jgi:hypothetical protein
MGLFEERGFELLRERWRSHRRVSKIPEMPTLDAMRDVPSRGDEAITREFEIKESRIEPTEGSSS